MEDHLEGALVEVRQEAAHEGTGVDDVGEDPRSKSCLSVIKFATNLQ